MSLQTQLSDYERKHQEDLERIRGFRLLDDDFMTKVFEDKDCAELLLRIILQKDDLTVRKVGVQTEIRNLQGRAIRMDIYTEDTDDKSYDAEIQRSNKGAGSKRARYNSSLLDANITEPGDDYGKLRETYVIFITEKDVLGGGKPIYHIDRTIEEMEHRKFNDEDHIIYVNAQIQDETALGKLMHDFFCTDAGDMNYKVLADRVRYFKEDKEGVGIMCQVMEEMRKQEREEGRQEGRLEGRQEGLQEAVTIFTSVRKGLLSVQEAAEKLGVSPAVLNVML